ncbi:MAG TPA: murein L,D-transpeptidase catalytic domain family protein [Gemmatimonadales bacterium]
MTRLLLAASPPADHDPGVVPSLKRAAERAGLRLNVLRLALQAHARAVAEGVTRRPLLTVIDYSLPSRVPRLWVLDLAHDSVLARELVAHGRKSGGDVAQYFSNQAGSLKSSLGTYVTGSIYRGSHGLSLRLRGLDRGLNDQAEARGIVIHGADYVAASVIPKLGRLGRSQGCPALSPEAAERLIPLVQGGTVVYAYYPSPRLGRTLPPL